MEALEKVVASLNSPNKGKRRRPVISLSATEQRKVCRILFSSATNVRRQEKSNQEKSIKICRKLLDHGLLTGCVSSQIADYFTKSKSSSDNDLLTMMMDTINDLPETCLVKILAYATTPENGTTSSIAAVNADRVPIVLRVLRYPYSPRSLTRELKFLPLCQLLTMLRFINLLFSRTLVSKKEANEKEDSEDDKAPSLIQVTDFLNCLLDASSSKPVISGGGREEFRSEIGLSSALANLTESLIPFYEQVRLHRSRAAASSSSGSNVYGRLRDYSIQVLTFQD